MAEWKSICSPKEEGGLKIMDIVCFNKVLLCKWIWICLVDDGSIWYNLFQQRYGNLKRRLVFVEGNKNKSKESLWWRDLLKLNYSDLTDGPGFQKLLNWCLGDGYSIPFWPAN